MEMGVKGFWLGFLIALICLDIFVAYLVIFANWEPTADVAVEAEKEGLLKESATEKAKDAEGFQVL